MLLRLPVLPELELVLEGEELWTPTVLLEEGELVKRGAGLEARRPVWKFEKFGKLLCLQLTV